MDCEEKETKNMKTSPLNRKALLAVLITLIWSTLLHAQTDLLSASSTGTNPVDFEFRSDGVLISKGNYGVGSLLSTDQGAGTRMLWYPALAAFRAGYVSGSQWNLANIGQYSVALGNNNQASGQCSTAMGNYSVASSQCSTAIGGMSIASALFQRRWGSQPPAAVFQRRWGSQPPAALIQRRWVCNQTPAVRIQQRWVSPQRPAVCIQRRWVL